MKTWNQYLTEKDEQEPLQGRNSLFKPQPPYTPHPEYPEVQWKVPDKKMRIYRTGGGPEIYILPEKFDMFDLHLDGGEWWAKFEVARWSGYSLVRTGQFKPLPIAPYDKVNGISPVSTDEFTPDNMKDLK